MSKKASNLNQLRQVKGIDSKNPIPSQFWDGLSESEKESMAKAIEEANEEYSNYDEWDEMNEEFYSHLRERFDKGPDEIGPRLWKSYQNKLIPMQLMVIPAGRQHDGEKVVQWFHTIVEDLHNGECNGEYALITESELLEKYNINFNN
tara:strand:+ start:94 stop:537 length:444 start_codon:yes stop_codon:yes gene_type:complete